MEVGYLACLFVCLTSRGDVVCCISSSLTVLVCCFCDVICLFEMCTDSVCSLGFW